jgi:hypothetical protein
MGRLLGRAYCFFMLLGLAANSRYLSTEILKPGTITTDRLHGMLKMNISRLVFRATSIRNGKP